MIDWRFWLGFAAVLPQALYVRQTALRLGPAQGPAAGVIDGRGEPLRLLLVGDSIIAGIGVAQLHDALPGQLARALAGSSGRPVQWRALGEGGLDAGEIHDQLLAAAEPEPVDLVVLSVGVNDVTGLRSRVHWRQRLGRLLDRLDSLHGAADGRCRVVHLGIPPLGHFPGLPQPLRALFGRRAAVLDEIAAEVVAQRPWAIHIRSEFVPSADQFAADGYHPNAAACGLWATGIVERLPPLNTASAATRGHQTDLVSFGNSG